MLEMTADGLLHLLDRERTIPYEGYPVTICRSRYGGVYEGAKFVAFPFDPDVVGATEYAGDDIACATFWHRADQIRLPLGRGSTSAEAHDDLMRRVAEWRKNAEAAHEVVVASATTGRVAELRARITRNPKLLGGKPTIRGMRITVGTILGQLAHGYTGEEILIDYPYLEGDDIQAALRFAYDLYERVEEPERMEEQP